MAGPNAECAHPPQAGPLGRRVYLFGVCAALQEPRTQGICYLLGQTDCSVATVLPAVA